MTAMTGCAPRFSNQSFYLDYYQIGNNGKILLTESNTYSGEYVALGSVLVSQRGGIEEKQVKVTSKDSFIDDGVYGADDAGIKTKSKLGDRKFATYSTALEEAVKIAQAKGGDAIINLKFKVLPEKPYERVEVSGMVIKRK